MQASKQARRGTPSTHSGGRVSFSLLLSFYCVLKELEAVLDEELLHHYNKRWTYFLFSRRVMSHTAEYINRQFVTREQDSHHRVLKLHDVRWQAECERRFSRTTISYPSLIRIYLATPDCRWRCFTGARTSSPLLAIRLTVEPLIPLATSSFLGLFTVLLAHHYSHSNSHPPPSLVRCS